MRLVVQRVTGASVCVDAAIVATIGAGLLLLVGVQAGDDGETARAVARKCAELRLFPGDSGHFDRSLVDAGGEALVVSQFTLVADVRKGRRPSFAAAAAPAIAEPLVDEFAAELRALGVRVEAGVFGAMMEVTLVNDGPVTVIVDSNDLNRPRRARPVAPGGDKTR